MRLVSMRLLPVLAILLFAVGCAVGPYRYPNYDPNWPTIEPVGELETVGNLRPELLWHTVGDVSARSISVADGDVVYARGIKQVFAFNRASGELRWRFETDDVLVGKLAVADSAVYVGSLGGSLFVLNADNGELLWRYAPGSWVYGPAAEDGAVFISTADDRVHALRGVNGSLIWRVHPGPLDSAPVVANGVVYVGGIIPFDDNKYVVHALDAASGALLWSTYLRYPPSFAPFRVGTPVLASGLLMWELPDFPYGFPEADDGVVFASRQFLSEDPDATHTFLEVIDGVALVSTLYQGIYALDASTGQLVWYFDVSILGYPAGLASAPAGSDGIVYVGLYNPSYYSGADGSSLALDAETGDILWHYRTAGGQGLAPAVAEGVAYACASDGHLYAFDAATGDLYWYYNIGGPTPCASAVADGAVYVTTNDGVLALRSVVME